MKRYLLIAVFSLVSCDDRVPNDSESRTTATALDSQSDVEKSAQLPKEFETLVSEIIRLMPDERKAEIREAPMAEIMVDHFGMGLALRNGELNQINSKVRRYLVRQGIFSRDDLSSIVLLTVNRRIRNEPIDLSGQIQSYRDYWAKQDLIAPLNLDCPECGEEMKVFYAGIGASKEQPDKEYFMGNCPNGNGFLYYHKDGWIPRP